MYKYLFSYSLALVPFATDKITAKVYANEDAFVSELQLLSNNCKYKTYLDHTIMLSFPRESWP